MKVFFFLTQMEGQNEIIVTSIVVQANLNSGENQFKQAKFTAIINYMITNKPED